MFESTAEVVPLPAAGALVLVPVLTALASVRATRATFVPRRAATVTAGAILVAVALTFALLPPLRGGGISRKIRFNTHGLDRSATVELVASYVRPLARRLLAGRTPPDVDLSSPTRPGTIVSPFTNARPLRTDVVLVMLESLGAPYLEEAPGTMPFLEELTARPGGIALARHYTTWSLTTHAFVSIWCSDLPYPTQEPLSLINPGLPCRSLSEVLHDAGYATAFLTSQDLGWDRQGRFFRARKLDVLQDRHSMPGHDGAWAGAWGIDDRLTVKNALALLHRPRDRPMFLAVGLVSGHHPYLALPEHGVADLKTRKERYLRAARAGDDRLRELVDGLVSAGRAERTLLVVASDHGEGTEGDRQGRHVYETSAWVPALVRGPQLGGIEGRVEELTSHLDLAPTILGLVGIPQPCTMLGRDLTRPVPRSVAVLGSAPPYSQRALIDLPMKLLLEEGEAPLLYDLAADPGELQDVSSQRADITARLVERAEALDGAARFRVEDYPAALARAGCVP